MDEFLDYNRYTNLDGVEWRIIDFLINSTDEHAESLWKMLKYNTIDLFFIYNLLFSSFIF